MGRYSFKLPDVGEGTAEAELVAWHVKPGDTVAEDQPVVDVMTDKATVEIPAPASGTVISIKGSPGEMLAVGSVILVLQVAGPGNLAAEESVGEGAPPTRRRRSGVGGAGPPPPTSCASRCAEGWPAGRTFERTDPHARERSRA